jgi:hypothetical protein
VQAHLLGNASDEGGLDFMVSEKMLRPLDAISSKLDARGKPGKPLGSSELLLLLLKLRRNPRLSGDSREPRRLFSSWSLEFLRVRLGGVNASKSSVILAPLRSSTWLGLTRPRFLTGIETDLGPCTLGVCGEGNRFIGILQDKAPFWSLLVTGVLIMSPWSVVCELLRDR